jgi:hypothetical protein
MKHSMPKKLKNNGKLLFFLTGRDPEISCYHHANYLLACGLTGSVTQHAWSIRAGRKLPQLEECAVRNGH